MKSTTVAIGVSIILLFSSIPFLTVANATIRRKPVDDNDYEVTDYVKLQDAVNSPEGRYFTVNKNTDMKKISIKAEDASGFFYYITGHIGPLWLPNKPLQFTIYEGSTEIMFDGEEQIVSDFPVHVFLIDFFGIGPSPVIRRRLDIDSIQLFGFCKAVVLTPYNETRLDIHDQPLFTITDLESLGQTAWGLTSADFNNDGWMDFAASWATDPWPASLPDAYISIYYNAKDTSFTRENVFTHNWEEWGYFEDLDSGDFDNDGDIDLLFSLSENIHQMKTNGTIYIVFNQGDNTFSDKILVAKHVSDVSDLYGRFNPQLTTADYDLDGDIDFLVGDNSGMVEFYRNTGNGTFTSAGILHDYGQHSWGLTSADYDHDGDVDFLVAAAFNDNEGEGYVYIKQNMIIESDSLTVFNQGAGETLFQYSSVRGGACIQSMDYNNDGDVDIILGKNDELYLYVKGENGFEIFPLNQFELYTNDIRLGGITAADYNNDGREDLATGGVRGDLRVLWNNYSEIVPPLWPRVIQPTGEYDPDIEMEFGFVSRDINGDNIFYYIDWGDGTNTGWIGPYPSGEEIRVSHVWEDEGGYWVRVKAKDIQGAESGWNNYRLILTKDKITNRNPMIYNISKGRDEALSSNQNSHFDVCKKMLFRFEMFPLLEKTLSILTSLKKSSLHIL